MRPFASAALCVVLLSLFGACGRSHCYVADAGSVLEEEDDAAIADPTGEVSDGTEAGEAEDATLRDAEVDASEAAESQVDAADPLCSAAKCSRRGTCSQVNGRPQCACEPGYAGTHCELSVVFVRADSSCTTACGGSWTHALRDLQTGLDTAHERGAEVWAARGSYLPMLGTGRQRTLQLRPKLAVYGGFAGDEREREARDPARVPTILSGDLGVPLQSWDDAYHVVTGAPGALLSGFTIQGGRADGAGDDARGGGLYSADGSTQVADCVFQNNLASDRGGAVYNLRTDSSFVRVSFGKNQAPLGGAMFNQSCSPRISASSFLENQASEKGGAMFNDSASPAIENSEFARNIAPEGGAIYNRMVSNPVVRATTFSANHADGLGGAIRNQYSAPQLEACRFSRNSAGNGGAIFTDYSFTPRVTGCVFLGNTAVENGGAMYNTLSTVEIRNSVFLGNTGRWGGAIASTGSATSIGHCTLASNWGEFGTELYVYAGSLNYGPSAVTNSILWTYGATRPIDIDERRGVSIQYSLVPSTCASIRNEFDACASGSGNLHDEPQFVEKPYIYQGMLMRDYDVRLKPGSPGINVGSPAASAGNDLEGKPRGALPDMGAYETDPER